MEKNGKLKNYNVSLKLKENVSPTYYEQRIKSRKGQNLSCKKTTIQL